MECLNTALFHVESVQMPLDLTAAQRIFSKSSDFKGIRVRVPQPVLLEFWIPDFVFDPAVLGGSQFPEDYVS